MKDQSNELKDKEQETNAIAQHTAIRPTTPIKNEEIEKILDEFDYITKTTVTTFGVREWLRAILESKDQQCEERVKEAVEELLNRICGHQRFATHCEFCDSNASVLAEIQDEHHNPNPTQT